MHTTVMKKTFTEINSYHINIEKMAVNPSRILRINKGSLSIDADADITIFDPSKEWTVDISKFQSKSKNSPFDGFTLCG